MSRGNGQGGTGRTGSISRTDIEAKLRAIRDSIEPVGDQAKGGLKAAIPVVVAVVVLVAYMLGRKGGKKRRAVIEIRRV